MIKILCVSLLIASVSCSYIDNSSSSKEKIVEGVKDHITSVPYLAQFLRYDYPVCAASIISEYWLITAAHCINDDVSTIRTGTTTKSPTKLGTEHQIEKIIKHEGYNQAASHFNNDIALIKLRQPIVFNNSQKPIALATSPAKLGQIGLVSGWGRSQTNELSNDLKSVRVPVIKREECQEHYPSSLPVTENMFCAGKGKGDACKGDSGGPNVIDGKLAGIVSFGLGCNIEYYPGVYTEVFNYRSWIEKHTGLKL